MNNYVNPRTTTLAIELFEDFRFEVASAIFALAGEFIEELAPFRHVTAENAAQAENAADEMYDALRQIEYDTEYAYSRARGEARLDEHEYCKEYLVARNRARLAELCGYAARQHRYWLACGYSEAAEIAAHMRGRGTHAAKEAAHAAKLNLKNRAEYLLCTESAEESAIVQLEKSQQYEKLIETVLESGVIAVQRGVNDTTNIRQMLVEYGEANEKHDEMMNMLSKAFASANALESRHRNELADLCHRLSDENWLIGLFVEFLHLCDSSSPLAAPAAITLLQEQVGKPEAERIVLEAVVAK